MRKRDGTFTYFVPDVAYHVTKWRRGYQRAINVQGSRSSQHRHARAGGTAGARDRHSRRLSGVRAASARHRDMRGGEEVKISKRAGSYVTVRDLIDDVGRDAVRYFFLMRRGDSQLSFDVDLARTAVGREPRVLRADGARTDVRDLPGRRSRAGERPTGDGVDLGSAGRARGAGTDQCADGLSRAVRAAAEALEPHRMTTYLHETAELAHRWYHRHHVLGDARALTEARLVLARATQIVLRNALGILGISAPERM